jgi:hypothetical protein
MFGPEVISRTERDGGSIETIMPVKGEVYYRSCAPVAITTNHP